MSKKNILIFGGSSGIGYTIAEKFSRAGYGVYVASNNKNDLEKTTKKLKSVKCFFADISNIGDVSSINNFFKKNKIKLNVLINSAGIIFPKNIDTLSLEEWEKEMEINLTAAFLLYKVFGKKIFQTNNKKRYNYWFNITSSAGVRLNPEWAGYSVSKSALNSLTKIMGDELQKNNILVNAVAPGRTNTKMRHDLFQNEDKKTLLSPKQIADLIFGLVKNNIFIYSQIFDIQPQRK